MTPNWTPDDEERLRRALQEEASRTLPSADGWDRIRERTRRVPFWKHPVVLGVAAATATAVVAIGAVYGVLRGPSDDATVSPVGPTTTTTTPGDAAATDETPDPDQDHDSGPTTDAPDRPDGTSGPTVSEADPLTAVTVPVYYLTATPAGVRLAREWRSVTSQRTPAETAVDTMLGEPLDSDYRTPWDPSTKVNSVEIHEGAIKVDLEIPARDATLPRDDAELAVQQLVYTATAAMNQAGKDGTLPVRILVDGERVGELWGVDLSNVLDRQAQLNVRQLVQLNDPTDGDTLGRPAVFTGEAAVFEGQLDWEVRQGDTVVKSDFTMTEEGQTFSRFEFEVDLPPGDYTITISATDPSGGEEGSGPMSDTRRFNVAD